MCCLKPSPAPRERGDPARRAGWVRVYDGKRCADSTVVAAREGNPVDLVNTEQADSAMFFADPKITLVASVKAVS